MNEQQTVIHKSIWGLVAILLAGLGVALLLLGVLYWLGAQHLLSFYSFVWVLALMVLSVAVAIIEAYVYWLSTLVFDARGVTVTNWLSLFYSVESRTDWKEIEDVTATQGGIIQKLTNTGTVLVQTAGTRTNLEMTWLPDPESIAGFIDKHIG